MELIQMKTFPLTGKSSVDNSSVNTKSGSVNLLPELFRWCMEALF